MNKQILISMAKKIVTCVAVIFCSAKQSFAENKCPTVDVFIGSYGIFNNLIPKKWKEYRCEASKAELPELIVSLQEQGSQSACLHCLDNFLNKRSYYDSYLNECGIEHDLYKFCDQIYPTTFKSCIRIARKLRDDLSDDAWLIDRLNDLISNFVYTCSARYNPSRKEVDSAISFLRDGRKTSKIEY